MHTSVIDDKLHWYKDAIIYEVHIKAFRDSNGDGIGDFGGLLEKLDYLQGLGVTAIWLLPFYPSPLRDDGYDIADYYSINPSYGTIRQFKQLVEEAHKRGLKVITELVINHTSDQHPWFQLARKSPVGSPEREYYVWTDDPKKYKDARIIFQDYELSNWTWDPVAQQYYWHRFFHHQPDLNYDNPEVQAEVFKIIDYWCAMGVDGFRLDAIPYMFERDGTNCENLPETHVYLKKLRAHVDKHFPGTLLLAEANMWPEDSASYFGNGDECQMNYHFPVMPRMFMALQMEDKYPITDIFDQTPVIPDTCQWAVFLRNHDELTLEMVTDEERDYMYKVYVKDPKARINLGIRHRLAPLMENNRKKIELLNYLLFSLPGTPVIYYGDEIGMGDNYYLGDRDGVRTPMQWSAERNAGFSETNPQKLYLPVITDPLYHYEYVNVDIESRNTSSLLWSMKRLINTRKKYKAFSRGDMQFVTSRNAKVLSFTRTCDEETLLVIVNLSRFSQPAEVDLSAYTGYQLTEVFSNNNFPSIKLDVPYLFTMSQYECQWFLLTKTTQDAETKEVLPTFELTHWSDLTNASTAEKLSSSILPDYLKKMRWFGGKAKLIQSIKITDHATLAVSGGECEILLIEVAYNSGLAEVYQLPVLFADADESQQLAEQYPSAIICKVNLDNKSGVLYDAIYSETYHDTIVKNMIDNFTAVTGSTGGIRFTSNENLKAHFQNREKINSKVLAAEQSNSSIIYDEAFFLKVYRKVDRSLNPDVEITRFLTERTNFKHVPLYTGDVQWITGSGTMVLGMMQELVKENTDGWSFILDKLRTFNDSVLTDPEAEIPQSGSSLMDRVDYNAIPSKQKQLLDTAVTERINLLGIRTAEMHLALASSNNDAAFKPEEFSLHYQRSLFASFQTLVRMTFESLAENYDKLPVDVKPEADALMGMKDAILTRLKNVYMNKFDTVKIRVHGDYHLGQTLFTGKDILILDFEGEPARSYSERRLKKSALKDVAGMIRSFHYAAYGSLYLNNNLKKDEINTLVPFVEQWQKYMSTFYVQAYLDTVKDSMLVPQNKDDLKILLETYILEKAIYELNYELNNRPDWVIIPIRGIKAIMQ